MYFSHEDYLGLIDRVNSLTIQNYGYQRDNYALERQLRQRNDPYWNDHSHSIVPFQKPYHGYPSDEKQNVLTPFSTRNSNPLAQLENAVKQQIKMSAQEQMNFIKAQIKKMKVQQSVQSNPSQNSRALNVYQKNTTNSDSQLSTQIKFLYKLWNKDEKQPTATDLCQWINKKNVQAEISKALKEQKKEYNPQVVSKPSHRIEKQEEEDRYQQKIQKHQQKRQSEKQKTSKRSVAPPPKRPTQKKVMEKKQKPLKQQIQPPSETSFLAEEQEQVSVFNQYSLEEDDGQYSEAKSMNIKEQVKKDQKHKESQKAQKQKKASQRSITQQKNPKVEKKTQSKKLLPPKKVKQDQKNVKLVKKSVTKMNKNTLDKSRASQKKNGKTQEKKIKDKKEKGVSKNKIESSSKLKEKKIKSSSKNVPEKPHSAVSIKQNIQKASNPKRKASGFLDLPPKSPTNKPKKTQKKIQSKKKIQKNQSQQKITKPTGSTHKIKKSQHNILQKSKAKASEGEKKEKVPKKSESSKKMDASSIKISKPKIKK